MPILDLDARFRELGRLRFGEDLGDHPTALEVWRLTSSHADLLDAAARLYGGTVKDWRDGYELTTEAAELEVLLPDQDVSAGQWLELWKGSTLARRCDGRDVVDTDHDGTFQPVGPCQCDPAERACKPVTHLRVILPQLPDLGVWRLVTRSVYAAIELPNSVQLLLATHGGELAPAILGLEKRRASKNRPYIIPVLRTRSTLQELEAGAPLAPPPPGASPPAGLELDPAGRPPTSTEHRPAELEPSKASQTPSDAPNEEDGPSVPNIPHHDEWLNLARLLRDNPPGGLAGYVSDELIAVLTELEELMVAVGLWSPTTAGVSPLDSSAARYEVPEWRDKAYTTPKLRAFAQRSLMAAGNAYLDHRFAGIISRELEEATP